MAHKVLALISFFVLLAKPSQTPAYTARL